MRYTVKCNECGREFVAETEKYGTMKYRCPYCGNVLTCRFDAPAAFRTRARSVLPLADATPVEVKKAAKLPTVDTNVLNTPSKESWQKRLIKLFKHHYMQVKLCVMQLIMPPSLCRNHPLVYVSFRRSTRMATYGYSLDSAFSSSYQCSFVYSSMRRL